jgi:hypothetical protein
MPQDQVKSPPKTPVPQDVKVAPRKAPKKRRIFRISMFHH